MREEPKTVVGGRKVGRSPGEARARARARSLARKSYAVAARDVPASGRQEGARVAAAAAAAALARQPQLLYV